MKKMKNHLYQIVREINNCKEKGKKYEMMEILERGINHLNASISHHQTFLGNEELLRLFKKYPKYNDCLTISQIGPCLYEVFAFSVGIAEIATEHNYICNMELQKSFDKFNDAENANAKKIENYKNKLVEIEEILHSGYLQCFWHDLKLRCFLTPSKYNKAMQVYRQRLKDCALDLSEEYKVQKMFSKNKENMYSVLADIQNYLRESLEKENYDCVENDYFEFFSATTALKMFENYQPEKKDLPDMHIDEFYVMEKKLSVNFD